MPRKPSGHARVYMLSVRLSDEELKQYASILTHFLSVDPLYALAVPIDSKLFRRLLDKLAPANTQVPWQQWAQPTHSRIKRQ